MQTELIWLGGLALCALIAALVGLVMFRGKDSHQRNSRDVGEPKRLSPQAQVYKLQISAKYWGYRVESHCHASARLAGSQHTFKDPLPLPIPGCDATTCKCCLIGLPERRLVLERRANPDRRQAIRVDSADRRDERPRRKDDLNSWVSYSHL